MKSINIYSQKQLNELINKGTVIGCCKCKAKFKEDDFAYAMNIGSCPYCHELLDKVKVK